MSNQSCQERHYLPLRALTRLRARDERLTLNPWENPPAAGAPRRASDLPQSDYSRALLLRLEPAVTGMLLDAARPAAEMRY